MKPIKILPTKEEKPSGSYKFVGNKLVYHDTTPQEREISKAKRAAIRREVRPRGEARKRIRRLLKYPHRIIRFEVFEAMQGVYEIRARQRNGSTVCLGSESQKTGIINGINKVDTARKMCRLLNKHWNFR
jgi:ribosome biogenesis protein Nip4